MKTLLILRHAKSSWDNANLADHDRPLNKRGKRDALRMGQLIKAQELTPDAILSSTAKRARKTAEEVALYCDFTGQIELLDGLYLAPAETYLEVLSAQADSLQRVLVVGHNPGLEELLRALTGVDEPLPTAALAQVALPIENWSQFLSRPSGNLEQCWRPKELE